MTRIFKHCLALALPLALAVNCFAAKKKEPPAPIFLASGFDFASVDQVTVLPIVDARIDKKATVNLEKLGRDAFNNIKKKNYPVQQGTSAGAAGEIREEDLVEAKPDWIRRLGPDNARWILVVALGDLESKITFGNVANAAVSAFLFDRSEGKLVWRDKGVGQAGQGGLAGMMFKSMDKGIALSAAVYSSLNTIPKRPKPKK